MTLSRARSIDELYEAVKDYDRVITKDAPLADALNFRLDQPRLETFAQTPRGLVYRQGIEADLRDRQELFLAVLRGTDLDWKEAFYYLRQALNCWEETGALEDLANFDLFGDEDGRAVVDVLGRTSSVFRALEDFDPVFDGDVAVVQPGKLTPLDRNVLPGEWTGIDPLTEESFEHPPFNIYPSTTSLVHSVVENVSRDNARDVAVVVDSESQYQPLLESAFREDEIPFMHERKLTEDEHFRTLFTLMRSAFNQRHLRVRDVIPILHRMDRRVPLKFHDSLLEAYDEDIIEPFRRVMDTVPSSSFRTVIEEYEELAGLDDRETLRSVLRDLGFLDETVTLRHLNRLKFYLSNFDEETDKEKDGVLFASPKNAAYVDRPLVFYLGMDASWTGAVQDPPRPWVDHERQRRNKLEDFQILLQNGERQYYLVQEHQMNSDVTPCFYFNVLFDEDFETFSDREDHRIMSGLPDLELSSGFEREPLGLDPGTVESLSQSSLNRLVKSPRDYFFDKLVPTVETLPMRRGQLFHDFAEFYVNHPEFVRETDRSVLVDLMVDEMSDLADEWNLKTLRTEFRIGTATIEEFLEREGYETFEPEGYDPNQFDRENVFTRAFDGRAITNPISEAWFEDTELGARGLVDLIPREDRIVDFKSGSSSNPNKVVQQATPGRFREDPDFQAILYLLHHSRRYPGRELRFTFFHFLDNLSDEIRGEGDLEDTLVTVTYYPRNFAEQVPRRETFEYLTGGVAESHDRRKTLETLEYDDFRRFFEGKGFPETREKDEAENSDFTGEFVAYCQREVGDYNYAENGAKSTIRKLVELRNGNFFEEDLERFRGFLQDQLDGLNRFRKTEFPVENEVEDLDLDDLNHRDLIVDDRYGT